MKPTLHEFTAPAIERDSAPQVAHQQVEPVTPESVAAALRAQRVEREEVLARLGPGWHFTPGGQLMRTPVRMRGLSPFELTDDLLLGLRLGNFCWFAIHGTTQH